MTKAETLDAKLSKLSLYRVSEKEARAHETKAAKLLAEHGYERIGKTVYYWNSNEDRIAGACVGRVDVVKSKGYSFHAWVNLSKDQGRPIAAALGHVKGEDSWPAPDFKKKKKKVSK